MRRFLAEAHDTHIGQLRRDHQRRLGVDQSVGIGDQHQHRHAHRFEPPIAAQQPSRGKRLDHPAPARWTEQQLGVGLVPEHLVVVATRIMRQQIFARDACRGQFVGLPRRARRIADAAEQPRKAFAERGTERAVQPEHRRAQRRRDRRDRPLDQRTQHEMPAHRMPHRHHRTDRLGRPFGPERPDISDIGREIVDVANMRVGRDAPRAALPAPVERGDRPALAMPVRQRFEILLEQVAAARLEQDRAAWRALRRPVETAKVPAVRTDPAGDAGAGGDRAAIQCWGNHEAGYFLESHAV